VSRGPGRIERAIDAALRDADRSFSVVELAALAYPGINRTEKKHSVSVLRAVNNIAERLFVWTWRTYEGASRFFFCNGSNVRSYAHGLLRIWGAERSLDEIDRILSDPEIQAVMSPGGLWWTEVEINKVEDELRRGGDTPELRRSIEALKIHHRNLFGEGTSYRAWHGHYPQLHQVHILLGRFEPPGTPVFEFTMEERRKHPVEIPLSY
jgi:hypothetical protein